MSKRVQIVSVLLTALVLGLCLLFLWRTDFFQARSIADVLAYFERFETSSMLIYFCIQLVSVILAPIPSNITAAAAGLLFGMWPAFFLSTGAVCLGSVIVFQVTKIIGREKALQLVSRKVSDKYLSIINAKWDTFLVLTFLFPFFPDDIICILAGLTPMSLKRFTVIMVLTRPWGMLVSSVFGGVVTRLPLWASAIFVVLCAALFLVGLKYGDRVENALIAWYRRRHPKAEDAEQENI